MPINTHTTEIETPAENFLIDVVPRGTLNNVAGLMELLLMLDLEGSDLTEGAQFSFCRLLEQSAQAIRHAERALAGREAAQ